MTCNHVRFIQKHKSKFVAQNLLHYCVKGGLSLILDAKDFYQFASFENHLKTGSFTVYGGCNDRVGGEKESGVCGRFVTEKTRSLCCIVTTIKLGVQHNYLSHQTYTCVKEGAI